MAPLRHPESGNAWHRRGKWAFDRLGQSRLLDALAGGAVCGCCEPRKRLGPIAHLTDPAAAAVR